MHRAGSYQSKREREWVKQWKVEEKRRGKGGPETSRGNKGGNADSGDEVRGVEVIQN